jgi:hypothetical protein
LADHPKKVVILLRSLQSDSNFPLSTNRPLLI